MQKKKELSQTDYEASIYSKLQIQVLRFAGIVHALEVAEEKAYLEDYNILHEDTMEYAIRCMEYFEKMALLVYSKISDNAEDKQSQSMSNSDVLRLFMQRFPEASQNQIALAIKRTPAYISQVKNGKA